MTSHFKYVILLLLTILFFTSCSTEKQLAYFQRDNLQKDNLTSAKPYVPVILAGDILSIYVNSLSPEASSFFNPFKSSTQTPSSSEEQSGTVGYLVDAQGKIDLPLIGSIKVGGATTSNVRDTLKTLLKPYLKEPTVNVRILNFKISILGEVSKPAVYKISNEVITLPEALSLAGDLTIYGRRDSIQIIREIDGKKEFGYVNLTNTEVFNSPYYYLHSNDLIYIKPSKLKNRQTNQSFQIAGFALSLISILVTVLRN